MTRGDVVVFAEGKPRPGIIVQADLIRTPVDILICPFTSTIVGAPIYRLTIYPDTSNELKSVSQLMIDRVGPVRQASMDRVIGRINSLDMARLDAALAALLGLTG